MTKSLPPLIAAAMIVFALAIAMRAVSGIGWPCEIDFYRDMGAAQGLIDGNLFGDPAYLGEIRWYNPLLPAVYASISGSTGLPLPIVVARAGPFLNLAGPLFFYLLAAALLGPVAALSALAAYLFLGNSAEPSWFHATYSPWAWPMNFTQGLAFAAFLAYVRARRSPGGSRETAAGVLLGLTALSHTAPAAILAMVIALDCSLDLAAGESRRTAARRLLLIGAVSFVASLPFLLPIFSAYRFRIVNPEPSGLSVFWGSSFLRNLISPVSAAAAAGLLILLREVAVSRARDERRLILLFTLVSFTLLCHGLSAQILRDRYGVDTVQLVPAFHFHLYLKAAESLLFGAALARLAGFTVARTGRAPARFAIHGLLACLVLARLPAHLRGVDLDFYRREALAYSADAERIAIYDWILGNTRPDDVFLAERDLAMFHVAAAGRKTVALDAQYSNPYVDFERRRAARQAMFDALRSGEREEFSRLAREYNVDYVLVRVDRPEECCALPSPPEWLAPGTSAGPFRVFRPL